MFAYYIPKENIVSQVRDF